MADVEVAGAGFVHAEVFVEADGGVGAVDIQFDGEGRRVDGFQKGETLFEQITADAFALTFG